MSTLITRWKTRLKGFIKKLFRQSQNRSQSMAAIKTESAKKLTLPPTALDLSLSQQEYDAFRMKAIVLLKKDAMLGTSLQALLKDPVVVKIGTRENQKVVVQLSQCFEWSGRIYQFQGEFLRDSTQKRYSIPLSKTFKITEKVF